ncbi:MAG: M28 family peptidase [Clostridia bacterium]|nr:M28 family peptidase [Clostridia bacterium]
MNFNKMTDSVFQSTQKLIDTFGPREAGSESCQNCADEILGELKGFADSAEKQSFNVHTGAFLGWIRMLVVFYAIAIALLWLRLPLFAGAILLLGIIILVFQFFLYRHFIDFLFPKKTGRNVWAAVEPSGEVKRQIIISGHHDSARVFNFFIHQPKLYALRVTGGIGIFVFVCVASFASLISPVINTITAVLASIGAVIVLQLWFFYSRHSTPGAGDNLIASMMAVEALRRISEEKKSGSPLKHTRVIALSFDGEEEGLRGAHAFAKENEDMLRSVPTYLYNIDCPYYLKDMFFLTSDINTSVKLSEDFATKCGESAEKLGYKVQVKPIAFLTGGTDAGEMAKRGVHATTMMAMPWDNTERASVYHTMNDTCDAVEKAAVKAGLEIFFDVVKGMDEE